MPEKILLILEATEGGTRRHLRELALSLPSHGFLPVLAVATERCGDFAADLPLYRAAGIPLHRLKLVRRPAPIGDLRALCALLRLIRRERPALIHAHSSKAGVLGRLAGALCRRPVVYTPHAFAFLMRGRPLTRSLYHLAERLLRPLTDHLIALSLEERAAALALGYPPARVTLIPNGVDPGRPLPLPERDQAPPSIGFFGRLEPQKGAEVLLQALPRLLSSHPLAHLHIHGAGREEPRLRALAQRLGLLANLTFHGSYPGSETLALMRQVDVIALPSHWEGAPYTVLESFMAGVPLVAAAVGGVREMITDNLNGVLVEPRNSRQLAEALASLLADAPRRRRLAENSRQSLANFTLRAMVEATAQIYATLASRG